MLETMVQFYGNLVVVGRFLVEQIVVVRGVVRSIICGIGGRMIACGRDFLLHLRFRLLGSLREETLHARLRRARMEDLRGR